MPLTFIALTISVSEISKKSSGEDEFESIVLYPGKFQVHGKWNSKLWHQAMLSTLYQSTSVGLSRHNEDTCNPTLQPIY